MHLLFKYHEKFLGGKKKVLKVYLEDSSFWRFMKVEELVLGPELILSDVRTRSGGILLFAGQMCHPLGRQMSPMHSTEKKHH